MGAVQSNPVKLLNYILLGLFETAAESWKAILSAATKANQTTAKQMISYSNFIVNKCSTHFLYGPLIQQYYRENAVMHKTS